MRRLLWVLLTVAAVPLLGAQNPSDTTRGAAAQHLRQEFRRRWNERVRQELSLSDDQAVKLQATEGKYLQQRRDVRAFLDRPVEFWRREGSARLLIGIAEA